MRLQLTIQRHALPPTNILWTVQAQDPTSTSAHASATISQLLEDVNDIVQLETENWGLEDYVVEVGGYECLHFQPIVSVLKEDDKVTIRALQTTDLRIRKIGGRHQITADGGHLIDGVPFGRPYLRKTARPAILIPPRKRRRVDVGHGQYPKDNSIPQALLPGSENVSSIELAVTDGEAGSNLSNEKLWQIVASQLSEDTDQASVGDGADDDFDSSFQSPSEEEGDEEDLELSEELKALLEDDPLEPCNKGAMENNPASGAEQDANCFNSTRQHKKRKRDFEVESEAGNMGSTGGSEVPTAPVHAAPHEQPIINAASTLGSKPPEQLRPTSTSIIVSKSGVWNGLGLAEAQRSSFDGFSGPDKKSPSSETGSSAVSEVRSSNSSLSGSESLSTSIEPESEAGSNSSSESDSESDSTSEEEEEVTTASLASYRAKKGEAAKTESSLSARPVSGQTAPGEGSKLTRKNNQRQRKKKRLRSLKVAGLLPPEAGFKELYTFEQTKSKELVTHHSAQRGGADDLFETRKQELLEQLVPREAESVTGLDPSNISGRAAAPPLAALNEEIHKATPVKRARLDLDSSRRMLFGSLGLKTPKTPAEEQDLREKLSKQGRTTTKCGSKHTVTAIGNPTETYAKSVSEVTESGAWIDKLIQSAVECEVEGQVLTTPPFPFVQRWQQGRQKNQLQVQLDGYDACGAESLQGTSAAAEEVEGGSPYIDGDSILDGVKLNGAIQNQLIREAEELSNRQEANSAIAPDLPLITDTDVLEALKVEDAVAGAVIAFKQLEVSKETNWRPEPSAYRTAKVQEVFEDGTLRIVLAERDKAPPSFDDRTGGRIFDKFEMPVEDEEEGTPDNGVREVLYCDLIEPKLVDGKAVDQAAPSTQEAQVSRSETRSNEKVSHGQDSAESTDHGAEEPVIQVEVSTPRQKEISKLIKDAGFHSSLDSELLQRISSSAEEVNHDEGSSHQTLEKHASSRPINLDGAPSEADDADLDSPLFVGSYSSVTHQGNEFHDSSTNFELEGQPSSIVGSQGEMDSGLPNGVIYPRISQFMTNESRTATVNGKPPSTRVNSSSPVKDAKPNHDSVAFDNDDDSIFEHEESLSLKSTIPPSEDAPKPDPPSPAGSQFTNPCLSELDGDASSENDLPSLGEIASTVRSGRVSPPHMKQSSTGNRKKSVSSDPPSTSDGSSSTEKPTHTQTSSSFQPTPIPPGSQVVDLTISSDPMSPLHSDEDYVSTQRSSVRIKQSSSQVQTGEKTGKRRLVRGR